MPTPRMAKPLPAMQIVTDEDIVFPVCVFMPDNFHYFAKDIEQFTSGTLQGLGKNGGKAERIVDCEGNTYRILKTEKVSHRGPFWGLTIWLEQKIWVRHQLEKFPEKMDLYTFKHMLTRTYREDWEMWNADGEIRKRFALVKNAPTFADIIKPLTDWFYGDYEAPDRAKKQLQAKTAKKKPGA